jgi:coenzyme F420-0:L-glutamate ligase/coenzyme F420-1:gamma-L-glutamate ligase
MTPASALELLPITGLPEVRAGDDVAALIYAAASAVGFGFEAADVLVVAQKIISKAEGRMVPLADVSPTARARELAALCRKDARLVELVLRESRRVVRCTENVLIVQHRLGFTVANAGIDQSNVAAGDAHALLLPADPDASACALRRALSERSGVALGVIVNDSFGRPWRRGTCGVAIGCAGLPALLDLRGRPDRFGRALRTSEVATADEVAAAASLVMGQAAEGIPAVVVRGLPAWERAGSAADLIRPEAQDLFP